MGISLDEFITRRTCDSLKLKMGAGSSVQKEYYNPTPKNPKRFKTYGDFEITLNKNPGELLIEIEHSSLGRLMALAVLLSDELPIKTEYSSVIKRIEKVRNINSTSLKVRVYLANYEPTEENFQAIYQSALRPLMMLMLPKTT